MKAWRDESELKERPVKDRCVIGSLASIIRRNVLIVVK